MYEERFVAALKANPIVVEILKRAPDLELPQWYLTAGGVFQTVWNVVAGRDPEAGIKDYDFFYFDDSDMSYDAEDRVIRRVADAFDDLDVDIEVRNQARVHLWYEQHFGVALRPYRSSEDAIDHFVSTTCCFGVRSDRHGDLSIYAPHGYSDLFDGIVRPNPRLPMRHVYEAKAERWTREWPQLTVVEWPS